MVLTSDLHEPHDLHSIVNLKSTPVSEHIFLFPFTWEVEGDPLTKAYK